MIAHRSGVPLYALALPDLPSPVYVAGRTSGAAGLTLDPKGANVFPSLNEAVIAASQLAEANSGISLHVVAHPRTRRLG